MAELEPHDPNQCQADITPAYGPFVLGPKPKPYRCKNKPVVIAYENEPGPDGLKGSMSLCEECFEAFQKKMPAGMCRFEVVK